MPDLILKNSEWLRGIGGANSGLWRNGQSCCLGVQAQAMGIAVDYLLHNGMPVELPVDEHCKAFRSMWTEEEGFDNNSLAGLAAVINDAREGEEVESNSDNRSTAVRLSIPLTPILSDEDRVERLRPIFAEVGWNLVWRPEE